LKEATTMQNGNLSGVSALVICTAIAFSVSGCSLIGYKIGSAIDKSKPDTETIEGWDCGNIKEGTKVTVNLRDGKYLEGVFDDLRESPADEYTGRYEEFRTAFANDLSLPGIGDTLRIIYWKSDQGQHEFDGFGYRYKSPTQRGEDDTSTLCQYLSATSTKQNDMKEFRLRYIDEISTNHGDTVDAKKIKTLASEGKIPLKNIMVINDLYGNRESVNVENIRSIEVPGRKRGRRTGLAIGVVLDVAYVAIALSVASTGGYGFGH
jgi:hypothetical protein